VSEMGKIVGRNVAALRRQRGLSLNELARISGLAKNTLVNIEGGAANPTVETLHVLTRALGATIVELISASPASGPEVVRADEGPTLDGLQMHVRIIYRVSSGSVSFETYEVSLEPGAEQDSPAHSPGVVEQVYVIAGRMRAGPVDRMSYLEPGDTVCFQGDVAHRYEAGTEPVRALMVMVTPALSPVLHQRP
jgi:transcriptional regulator with XRE-family HTH domain